MSGQLDGSPLQSAFGFGAASGSGSADSDSDSDSVAVAVGLGPLVAEVVGAVEGDRVARDDSPPPEHPDSSTIAATGTAIRRTSYERVAMTTTTYDVRPKFSRRGG